jgi:AraC-like DNA-binding protein
MICEALLKYMEEEKPYLNSKLKLFDISNALNYSQTKLSQILSQKLNTNFTDFTNKYRVEAFKENTQKDSLHQYTLSSLSQQCGFNSRSSFFNVFKKITGQTPLEYLKQSGIILNKEK